MTILDQLPTLSKWDPGVAGESGLDPLGLSPIADRIADRMAPGFRARMNHPHFLTLSAVSAVVCSPFHGATGPDGTTRPDIVAEWVMLMYIGAGDRAQLNGFPGRDKTWAALNTKAALSPGMYLRGPRVFGFTGVYRPLALDLEIVDPEGLPMRAAEELVLAWEQEQGLHGFLNGTPETVGGRVRDALAKRIRSSLEAGQCKDHRLISGLSREVFIAARMGPRVRGVLGDLIRGGDHDQRPELVDLLTRAVDDGAALDLADHQLGAWALPWAGQRLTATLNAADRFEHLAVLMDRAFRTHLSSSTSVTRDGLTASTVLQHATAEIPRARSEAIDAVERIDCDGPVLAERLSHLTSGLEHATGPADLFDRLMACHHRVQSGRRKAPWYDDVDGGWFPRGSHRSEVSDPADESWLHPYRLTTVRDFVAAVR